MIVRDQPKFRPAALIFKPMLRFGWAYILSGNWRYGMKGFVWSAMHANYEFMRQAKAWELLTVQPAPHPRGEDIDAG